MVEITSYKTRPINFLSYALEELELSFKETSRKIIYEYKEDFMATLTHPHHTHSHVPWREKKRDILKVNDSSSEVIVPFGRVLLSLIFIIAGFSHFTGATVSYAANSGVPFADILVPISGVMAIVGGISVALGVRARMGALLLILFMIPVTFIMHNFWSIDDPQMVQQQMSHFMKNIAILGGLFFVVFYGAGAYSWDRKHKD
jgi:putative oxidoreductase